MPGTWHPMGIGTRGERILVGGVCGAEDTTSTASPRGPAPTQAAAFVLEYTGARDGSGTFATIFAMTMDYDRGCGTNVACNNATSTAGSINSADWVAWNEYPRYSATRRTPTGSRPTLSRCSPTSRSPTAATSCSPSGTAGPTSSPPA
jgi:hypothetical protein